MIGKYLPRLILTGISLVVVGLSVFATQKGPVEILEGNVLSEKAESMTSGPTPIPTPVATADSTATPTPQLATNNLSDWIYPGSAVLASDELLLSLSSNDSPKVITDWYKNKIKSTGANVTSFVTTSTNGEILNKLVGASSDFEIHIEIKKSADSSDLIINITKT